MNDLQLLEDQYEYDNYLCDYSNEDIFQGRINQLENVYFRNLITRIYANRHWMRALLNYMPSYDFDGEKLLIDDWNVEDFKEFIKVFWYSAFGDKLNLEEGSVQWYCWLNFHQQLAQLDAATTDLSSFSIEMLNPHGKYRSVLRQGTFQLSGQQLLNLYLFTKWIDLISNFIEQHYRHFNLTSIGKPLIILGSSGVGNFNQGLAFAAERRIWRRQHGRTWRPPEAVQNFLQYLNTAVGQDRRYIDWKCTQAKQYTFFLNICLHSEAPQNANHQPIKALASIALINQMLSHARMRGIQVALLDLRIGHHVAEVNLNGAISRNDATGRYSKYGFRDNWLAVLRNDGHFHHVHRIGNTGKWYFGGQNGERIVEILQELYQLDYPIELLYMR